MHRIGKITGLRKHQSNYKGGVQRLYIKGSSPSTSPTCVGEDILILIVACVSTSLATSNWVNSYVVLKSSNEKSRLQCTMLVKVPSTLKRHCCLESLAAKHESIHLNKKRVVIFSFGS